MILHNCLVIVKHNVLMQWQCQNCSGRHGRVAEGRWRCRGQLLITLFHWVTLILSLKYLLHCWNNNNVDPNIKILKKCSRTDLVPLTPAGALVDETFPTVPIANRFMNTTPADFHLLRILLECLMVVNDVFPVSLRSQPLSRKRLAEPLNGWLSDLSR